VSDSTKPSASTGEHQVIYRKDYAAPVFTITATHLDFDIRDNLTRVKSRLEVERINEGPAQLRLHGEELVLKRVAIDGRELGNNEYQVNDAFLSLASVPDQFTLEIDTEICPEQNTALEGLYKSKTMYCTQCEAEGFRNITYYLDQPDVLSVFTTRVEANAKAYPVLLSNGNKVDDELLPSGRRAVTWHDPFPKPSYLFALVAGDLALLEDRFTTCSGREITLQIFSEAHNIAQCDYAMDALKRSMRWDEKVYGREYDLDIFMIVAVEDFNMGAMENKGLNIFNTSCVLATPDTATDAGYQRVEAVVAHEYFHNWSGNRVTCRDWFQLSLKEGFTVFRDAEFSADMNAATVKRIEDVAHLRAVQFAEDAGPMAHSIRPDSFIEISNFYTTTIYEKGAEIVRMLRTLLGAEGFRKGSDLYFSRHDGQAVTTEDFVCAMEQANQIELANFRQWYQQAGTPRVHVAQTRSSGGLDITIDQSCPATPGQETKAPFHLPLTLGLVDASGAEIAPSDLHTSSGAAVSPRPDGLLVEFAEPLTRLRINDVPKGAVLSALRGFSAPVVMSTNRSTAELIHLVAHDSDGFSRWDTCQTLLAQQISNLANDSTSSVDEHLTQMLGQLLEQAIAVASDPSAAEQKALLAKLLQLPTEADLFERDRPVKVLELLDARDMLKRHIAVTFSEQWQTLYDVLERKPSYAPDVDSIAHRALKNRALAGIAQAAAADMPETILAAHYDLADNLTDRRAALAVVLGVPGFSTELIERLLGDFYNAWQHEALVMDAWLSLQAGSQLPGALARVEALEDHAAFDRNNPNKVRALYGAFAMANHRNFHAADGSGYEFLAKRIAALNASNPQVASRLTGPLTQWQRYTRDRQLQMRAALEQVLATERLSPNVYELVAKSLAAGE